MDMGGLLPDIQDEIGFRVDAAAERMLRADTEPRVSRSGTFVKGDRRPALRRQALGNFVPAVSF
jgi:hypothetical protein